MRTKGRIIHIYFRADMYLWLYCWDFFFKKMCFDVLLVYLCTVCTVPREARREHQTQKLESQMTWATILVLGIKPGSSRRAVNVLNPWTISAALVSFCTMVLALPQIGCHDSCSSCIYSPSLNSSLGMLCVSLMKVPIFYYLRSSCSVFW